MSWVWVGLGIALLVLLLVDVFATVFHAQGVGGPVSHFLYRAVWAVFSYFGTDRDGAPRPRVLALAGPAMVVALLIGWVLLLTVAYALVYYPWIEGFHASPGAVLVPWADALYYSGYTGATLGFGDLVPRHRALRLLAPLQAFSGFALISASITYLLATYRELLEMRSLAQRIDGYFRATGLGDLRLDGSGEMEAAARWAESIEERFVHMLQAHFQYPILHYFRSGTEAWALPVQLGRILELRETAVARAGEEPLGSIRRHPSFLALFEAVHAYLTEVERNFVPDTVRPEGAGDEALEEGGVRGDAAAHRRLLRHLHYE